MVKAANWPSHLERDQRSPLWRHWWEELAKDHLLDIQDKAGSVCSAGLYCMSRLLRGQAFRRGCEAGSVGEEDRDGAALAFQVGTAADDLGRQVLRLGLCGPNPRGRWAHRTRP